MSGRLLGPGDHRFGDLATGDRLQTATAVLSPEMIDRFADLSGDRFAIHMSDTAAQALGFPCRVAHGLLVLSVIDGLKNQSPARLCAVASLGWEWSFQRPVLAGDTVEASFTVEAKRPTRDPARGIVTFAVEVRNQTGAIVQQGRNMLMMQV